MKRSGWTLVEIAITIAVAAILASGAISIFVPHINSLYHVVGSTTLQTAVANTIKIIVEGDALSRGLRFADPSQPITSASGSTLNYRYYDLTQLSDEDPHTVSITYNPSQHVVTRIIDSGAASYVPRYAPPGGAIAIDALESNFFRYYDSSGAELTGSIDPNAIARVTVGVEAAYASGLPHFGGAKIRLKSGVFIKRNS